MKIQTFQIQGTTFLYTCVMPAGNNNNLAPVVSFIAKPSPPWTLNDLEEAGRIRLMVHFEHMQNKVGLTIKAVSAKITNNAKAESTISLPKMITSYSNLESSDNFERKHAVTYHYSSAELVQKEPEVWYGEIVIPCNWLEGGSKTFERTGSFSPSYDDNSFTMTISCMLSNNNAPESNRSHVVEINSTDAFHWEQQA